MWEWLHSVARLKNTLQQERDKCAALEGRLGVLHEQATRLKAEVKHWQHLYSVAKKEAK